MKKIILTAIALTVTATAFAQFPKGLSVGAGYLNSDMKYKYQDNSHTESLGGFFLRADYNISLGEAFGVAPGVAVDFITGEEQGVKDQFINLDIPVMFNYAFPVADIVKIIPFAGPTFQLGLSGKQKVGDDSADYYKDGSEISRLELYIGGGVAVDIAEIVRVHIGYDAGILNRYTGDWDDYTIKNNGLHFGVAYLF